MTKELGNYETSYFIMNVPTKADLEIRDMSNDSLVRYITTMFCTWSRYF